MTGYDNPRHKSCTTSNGCPATLFGVKKPSGEAAKQCVRRLLYVFLPAAFRASGFGPTMVQVFCGLDFTIAEPASRQPHSTT